MENELYVSCHAPSLSLLLYETVRSVHDQKGLLIGEICKEVITEKTDDNEMKRKHRTTIYLEHCIPIKDKDFFGNVGNVNVEKLEKYVKQYYDKIVGWYSFRRNIRVNCRTLREVMTHKSLIQSLHHVKPEHFVAAFMSASVGAGLSTHTYNHIFMRFHPERDAFEPLKLKIYTMSDKIVGVNGYPVNNTFPASGKFQSIITPIQEGDCPVKSILTINKAVGEHLKVVDKKLQEAERKRSDLEKQIKNLRKRLLLDKLQDVKVRELEQEPIGPELMYIQYNPKTIYNPGRTESPIKVMPFETPRVPEEPEDVQIRNSQPEVNSSTSHPPG
ncbi:UNVERIFIED_CONTAM: hypothetical protein PYX00_007726 [Menopon gallinae]|uniref:BRCA1-A complex subunit Abraxas 1 n=1 Tax=Menopon gallinae TaxID=328185 RepID=A0AAW2HKA6_9NEOP